jgi:D-alanyl-D-alanine carboxypeptidase/D-alanyl-D-alanine carboxypeptidase (penicillin-binding protein 5/6)
MTALLAIESDRLDESVKITLPMLQTEGSSLGLKEGDVITLNDLVIGMMLTSGNDSANAIAYFIAGSIDEFANMMNNRAKEIGMNDTLFVTPSGLDEGNHHSTAYDMALLACTAISNETFCEIVSMKSAQITINNSEVMVYNHNKLLSMDDNFFGIKTGYTEKAGRCLVSAKNYNGNKMICVTLSAPDDWNDHINLLNECEEKYNEYSISDTINVNVVGGNANTVKATYSKKIYILSGVEIKIYHRPFVYAPIQKGDKIGYVCVYYNKKLIERLPIEADEDVKYYGEQERS